MPQKIKRISQNEKYDLLNYPVLDMVVNCDNCFSNIYNNNIFIFMSVSRITNEKERSLRIREKPHFTQTDEIKIIILKEGLEKWASKFKTKDLRIIMRNINEDYAIRNTNFESKKTPLEFCGFFAYGKNFEKNKNKIEINHMYLFNYEFLYCIIL
jgi:hypothetical protein